MIEEKIMYTLLCDRCGADPEPDEEPCVYDDADYIREIASKNGWEQSEDGSDLCPDCYTIDEDDKIVEKPVEQPNT